MDKFTFYLNEKTIDFGIDTCKFFIGNNYAMKFDMLKTLRQTYQNVKATEIMVEDNLTSKFTFNDSPVNIQKGKFFEVNEYKEYKEDLKLKSKTITKTIIEKLFNTIENNDTFQTLKILYEDFADELNKRTDYQIEELNLELLFEPFGAKSLIKLLSYILTYKNEQINEYALSYDETILLQLKLIKTLDNLLEEGHIIVYYGANHLTPTINNYIIHNDWAITYFLIASEVSSINNPNDILLIDNKIVDLADNHAVYEELVLPSSKNHTIETIKSIITQKINSRKISIFSDNF
ncbi:MAG: hypothetical protein ACOC2U_03170 [bacterium]